MTRLSLRWFAAAGLVTGVGALPAAAQGVRISGTTWVQSIDLRPLRQDSVLASLVPGTGGGRRTAEGQLVQCPEATTYCYFATSGERDTTNPLLQDLSIAAWGLGEGISAHAHLRARASVGGESALWPRLDDHFDALEAYVQVDRRAGRARLGRMWATSGLGAYNFDGGALLLRRGAHSIEAFGGRALVQGLNEPYTSAEIGAVDDLPPEDDGYIIGARLRLRPTDLSAISAVYQRVIAADRSSLYSERVALDGMTRLVGLALDGSVTYDVAGGILNEARLRAARRLPFGFDGAIEGRRHRPFFELWTIWGAFSPVGFDEGRAELSWHPATERLQLTAHGGYRTYADDPSGLSYLPLRSDGWRAGLEATWLASEQLAASANYATDIGFGASRTDVSGGVRWTPSERLTLGATVTGFQSIYEFRVGTGRVIGGLVNGAVRLTPDLRVAFDGGLYRHRLTDDAPGTDWSQRRASLRLEWTVGSEPGMSGGRGR
ncbi:MAG: hypothetical protein ACLGIK_04100 [Gemmatimonadota bacterium]